MNFLIPELICYFVGILGVIMSIVILIKSKRITIVRITLAAYLVTASVIIILGAITFSGKIVNYPHLLRVDSPIHFLFPPLGFFFVYSVFNTGFKLKWIHLINFLPFLINIIVFIPFYLKDSPYKIAYYQESIATTGLFIMPIAYSLKTLNVFVYFIMQVYVIYKYQTKKTSNANINATTIVWFWVLIIGKAILTVGLIIDQVIWFRLIEDPYRFAILMVTFFVCYIVLSLLLFPRILYGNYEIPEAIIPKTKYIRSRLTVQEKELILERLKVYLNDISKPYLNPNISLHKVALSIDINPIELSQVINEMIGQNFNDYINTFRVNEAKSILASPEYEKFTIETIAKMAGFNSKSTFYSAFKRNLGVNPKEFITMQLSKN